VSIDLSKSLLFRSERTELKVQRFIFGFSSSFREHRPSLSEPPNLEIGSDFSNLPFSFLGQISRLSIEGNYSQKENCKATWKIVCWIGSAYCVLSDRELVLLDVCSLRRRRRVSDFGEISANSLFAGFS